MADQNSNAPVAKLQLLRSFEFNSQSLKSGALIISDDGPQNGGLLFVKGAHTAIKALCTPKSLPEEFDEVRSHTLVLMHPIGRKVLCEGSKPISSSCASDADG